MIDRLPERWLVLGWLLYGLAAVVPFLLTEQVAAPDDAIAAVAGDTSRARLVRNVASLTDDDGFYYLRIAQHAAAGAGSTFDGRHPTNGYHPLWLLCLVPAARLFPAAEAFLLASFALQALAAALATALVYRTARLATGRLAASVAALVWVRIQLTYLTPWSGMETALNALAVAGLLYLFLRISRQERAPSRRVLLGLGVVAGLAFLARLDNLLLATVLAAALAPRRPGGAAVFALPVAVAAAAYAGFNLQLFGHAVPVSGELKRVWSAELLAQDPRYLEHGWLVAKLAYLLWPLGHLSRSFAASLVVGSLGAAAAVAVPRLRGLLAPALRPVVVFSVLQILAYAALYHGGFSFQPWVYVVQHLMTALLAAAAVDAAGRWLTRRFSGRTATAAAVLLVTAVLLSTAAVAERRRDRQRLYGSEPLYAAAGWARAHLPPGATVGAWNAGTLGFFSGRRVVNLDGLVNSWSFYRSGRHDLCAYLEREGITHLVDVFEAGRPLGTHVGELDRCASRLERIWSGPGISGTARRAEALRLAAGRGR